MSFASQLDLDGRLLWWGLQVFRNALPFPDAQYGTLSGVTDVNSGMWDGRILEVGNIQRGLGNDHQPVASTVALTLDNTDFAADFLCDQATAYAMGATFRLFVGLGDENGVVVTKRIGDFVCLEYPSRDDGHVYLSLADNALGQLSDLLVPPAPYDWLLQWRAGLETSACFGNPADSTQDPVPLFDWTTPAPLSFGTAIAEPFVGVPLCTFNVWRTPVDFDLANFDPGRRPYIMPILVLATRDTTAITTIDIAESGQMLGVYNDAIIGAQQYAGSQLLIPPTFYDSGVPATYRIWKAYKTDHVDVVGPDGNIYPFSLLWVAMDVGAYLYWLTINDPNINGSVPISSAFGSNFPTVVFAPPLPVPTPEQCNGLFAAFSHFTFQGSPGSQVNGRSTLARHGNPADILQDLVEQYSVMGTGSLDPTRAARVRLNAKIHLRGNIVPDSQAQTGGVQLGTNKRTAYGIGTLRKALAEVCASADVDLYCEMSGQVGIVTQGADFETQTSVYPAISETRIGSVTEHIPSSGERWSPYNRVFVQTEGGSNGPYDNGVAIQAWQRIIPKVIDAKWWAEYSSSRLFTDQQNRLEATSDVWARRNLESVVRPTIEFITDVGILALDLGDYFTMSWTRGGRALPYQNTLWKLESVDIAPKNGSVRAGAVWMGDLQTQQPFLIDDETLVVRAATGAATLTVTTGSTTVLRSAGSFITDGLAPNDVILMRDATEALTGFTRNRQIKVVSITDATHAVVADSAFGAAGSHVLAATDWTMQRSYRTYPTVITDPTNYPSGSAMYGKVSTLAGLFSDGTQANKL